MMEQRNRAWRRHQLYRNWHRRLKNELHWYPNTFNNNTWKDIKDSKPERNSNYFCIFKTTGKPCSCYRCAGPHYKRLYYKFDTDRIIREELYDDLSNQNPRSHNRKIVDWD